MKEKEREREGERECNKMFWGRGEAPTLWGNITTL